MIISPGWPYATKAVIQHNFDAGHLDVYMTFYEKMNILVCPSTASFILEIDDVGSEVSSIGWLDPWTLQLIDDSVMANPDKVTIEFPEPTNLLRTTGGKQWDIFGKIVSQEI